MRARHAGFRTILTGLATVYHEGGQSLGALGRRGRLVTCGGRFDSTTGNYVDNIIAFGTLRSLRAAA